MDIEFDEKKNQLNIKKHGVSFLEAKNINWDSLWAFEDNRKNYNEIRMIGYVLIVSRLYNIVYTLRGSSVRIISLRKANKKEVLNYANNN